MIIDIVIIFYAIQNDLLVYQYMTPKKPILLF